MRNRGSENLGSQLLKRATRLDQLPPDMEATVGFLPTPETL